MRSDILRITIILFLVIAGVTLVTHSQRNAELATGNSIVFNLNTDLENQDEGTIIIWLKPGFGNIPQEINKKVSNIILFQSSKVKNLNIFYNTKMQSLYAGIPIIGDQVIFNKEKPDMIAYTYKKHADQALYFNAKQIGRSKFRPSIQITGDVIKKLPELVENNGNIQDIKIIPKALTTQELKELI